MKRTVKYRGPGYDVMRALFRNKLAMACLVIILILVLIACTVDLFFDYETDVIVEYFIRKMDYDIDAINSELASKNLPTLGASMK